MVCESDQAAFCDVKSNGNVEGSCEPLKSGQSHEELVQWLIKRTGLSRAEVVDASGEIRRQGGKTRGPGVSFSLPGNIPKAGGSPRRQGGPSNQPLSEVPQSAAPKSALITCEVCVNGRCESRTATDPAGAQASAVSALCGTDLGCAKNAKPSCKAQK